MRLIQQVQSLSTPVAAALHTMPQSQTSTMADPAQHCDDGVNGGWAVIAARAAKMGSALDQQILFIRRIAADR
jgi:hypothetical protein